MQKLSIVIPVFNEKNTILEVLKRIDAVVLPLEKEIVLVDDASPFLLKKLCLIYYKNTNK